MHLMAGEGLAIEPNADFSQSRPAEIQFVGSALPSSQLSIRKCNHENWIRCFAKPIAGRAALLRRRID